jgi:hypothetical protein
MKRPGFSESQISVVLKQAEDGSGTSEMRHKAGLLFRNPQTFIS